METIPWISRHALTAAQEKTLEKMGYKAGEKKDLSFSSDPVNDLKKSKITGTTIALVAPSFVVLKLISNGYKIIEFVNEPSKRAKGVFVCKGAYSHFMEGCSIISTYFECPVPIEQQEESSLSPVEKR